mmetsp:Transcript_37750/g.84149  ORF Transcript_37750/g.84149 Transcript_37750/m.84149 type:complete len:242 (+) Transcript_37750:290-1015(+)
MTSSVLVFTTSSIFLTYWSVIFCSASSRSFLESLGSSTLSIFFLTSVRTLRTATLLSSPNFAAVLASSLRRSCVRGGTTRRIFSPSLVGLMPMSLSSSAFSMGLRDALSKGLMSRVVASGTEMEATRLMGVGLPNWSTMIRSKMAGLARPVRMVFRLSARAATAFFMRSSASALASFSTLAVSPDASAAPLPPLPPLPPFGESTTSAEAPLPFLASAMIDRRNAIPERRHGVTETAFTGAT